MRQIPMRYWWPADYARELGVESCSADGCYRVVAYNGQTGERGGRSVETFETADAAYAVVAAWHRGDAVPVRVEVVPCACAFCEKVRARRLYDRPHRVGVR